MAKGFGLSGWGADGSECGGSSAGYRIGGGVCGDSERCECGALESGGDSAASAAGVRVFVFGSFRDRACKQLSCRGGARWG